MVDTIKEIVGAVNYLPSYLLDDDIACLYKYSNLIKEGSVLDIGTGWGKSAVVLNLSNPKNRVYTCDPGNTPIAMGWALSTQDYSDKIEEILTRHDLYHSVTFYLGGAEQFMHNFPSHRFALIHLDNWADMNATDSTLFLKRVIERLKPGGYMLFRNYGLPDREPYTASIDKAVAQTKLSFLEKTGNTSVYQK